MKDSNRSIVVHQPTNKKYLVHKTVLEMKDQNDNQTDQNNQKEEPFIIERKNSANDDQSKRKTIHFSDGIFEVDENGNLIEEKKREKRSLRSVVKHRTWNVFDSVDSPMLNSATSFGSTVGRKTLSAIDYVGNKFASFIGITGHKYGTDTNA